MDDIRQYWNKRAIEAAGEPSATTNDIYLRTLESTALLNELRPLFGEKNARVLDVGCGDGQTILSLAAHLPKTSFFGVDFSSEMIASAKSNVSRASKTLDVRFEIGDARALRDVVGSSK